MSDVTKDEEYFSKLEIYRFFCTIIFSYIAIYISGKYYFTNFDQLLLFKYFGYLPDHRLNTLLQFSQGTITYYIASLICAPVVAIAMALLFFYLYYFNVYKKGLIQKKYVHFFNYIYASIACIAFLSAIFYINYFYTPSYFDPRWPGNARIIFSPNFEIYSSLCNYVLSTIIYYALASIFKISFKPVSND